MNTFFDTTGSLNLDDLIMHKPSFRQIMADGKVTEEELQQQSQHVKTILHELERSLAPDQIDLVRALLAEISVLVAARSIFNSQQQ